MDTQVPLGESEPFGREDTVQELTVSSIKEFDEMVYQLERAAVAEETRAVARCTTFGSSGISDPQYRCVFSFFLKRRAGSVDTRVANVACE